MIMTKNHPDRARMAGMIAKSKALRAVLLLLFMVCLALSARADDGSPKDVVIRVQPGVNALALAADYKTTIASHVFGTALYSLYVPNGDNENSFVTRLNADPRVVYAEKEGKLGNPETTGTQIHFAFDKGPKAGAYVNSWAYLQINARKANKLSTGAGVIVAVLDTGVTFTHPALRGHLLPGYNALAPGSAPLDLADGTTNIATGHGTMIAGLIARLAPNAQIMPVRVLNGDGIGTTLPIVAGIHWAILHGAKVINMSFGSPVPADALSEAMDEAELAGVVLVASAGNDGANVARYPAVLSNVIDVAAVEANNVKAAYSNFGSFVRVVAPGTGIRSTYWTGGYATWSGTSFAAPFVTAEAVLLRSAFPKMLAEDVVSRIRQTARSVDTNNPLYKQMLGNGIIDVTTALTTKDGGD